MSAFTETTHDNSAVCEQKSAAAAAERVRLSSATKQATSKQDFAIAGVSESGKWHFCIAADGHGRTSKTIDYLRSRNWSTLIDHKSLQCLITILREDIGKLKGTLSVLFAGLVFPLVFISISKRKNTLPMSFTFFEFANVSAPTSKIKSPFAM